MPLTLTTCYLLLMRGAQRAATQRAHAALLKEHGLTHEELPLLTLDQEDLETPFEEAPESFDDGAVADAPAER